MSEFERIVRVKPAYDCLVVRPCVHGSEKCGTTPGFNHGRHAAELHMIVRTPVAEVILGIGTGWDLPETPANFRDRQGPRGLFVEFHSSVPRYEGHETQGTTCELWPEGCYGDVGYSMSDIPAELLVRKGSDAVWEWLENEHREAFSSASREGVAR